LFGNKCEGSLLGTAMLTAERCRVRAAECQRMAAQAPNARVRDILIDMARTWMRLALEAEQWTMARDGGLGHVRAGVARPDPACLQHMPRGPHARSSAGAGYACSARPTATVCRSFPKISSALSAKVCGRSRSPKRLRLPYERSDHERGATTVSVCIGQDQRAGADLGEAAGAADGAGKRSGSAVGREPRRSFAKAGRRARCGGAATRPASSYKGLRSFAIPPSPPESVSSAQSRPWRRRSGSRRARSMCATRLKLIVAGPPKTWSLPARRCPRRRTAERISA
jgi:hypothetical protein